MKLGDLIRRSMLSLQRHGTRYDGDDGVLFQPSHDVTDIYSIVDDSREVIPGSLFFALKGAEHDGRKFIPEALERGASAIFVDHEWWLKERHAYQEADYPKKGPFHGGASSVVFVPSMQDPRSAQAHIANAFYNFPSKDFCLIGVTGTNGKTTIVSMIAHLAKTLGISVSAIGTLGIQSFFPEKETEARAACESLSTGGLTTPDSLRLCKIFSQLRTAKIQLVAMEVSSQALSQYRVEGCDFDAMVFSSFSQDHLDLHKTMDSYLSSKLRVFSLLHKSQGKKDKKKYAVVASSVMADEHYGERVINSLRIYKDIFSFYYDNHRLWPCNDDLSVMRSDVSSRSTVNPFLATEAIKSFSLEMNSLQGRHNKENAVAAYSCVSLLFPDIFPKGEKKYCKDVFKDLVIPGRWEIYTSYNGLFHYVIDYAHTPDALIRVLDTAQSLEYARIIIIIGCGGERDKEKRPIMGKIAVSRGTIAIFSSDNARGEDPHKIIYDMTEDLNCEDKERFIAISDRRQAIRAAMAMAKARDIIIIAGKGHEAYQDMGEGQLPFCDKDEAHAANKWLSNLDSINY